MAKPGSLSATANATLTFQATPSFGFSFVRWVDSDADETLSTSNPCSMKITRDMRVMAVFKQNFSIIPPQN
jgi:hypothetical protein